MTNTATKTQSTTSDSKRRIISFLIQFSAYVISFYVAFTVLDLSPGWALAVGYVCGIGLGHLFRLTISFLKSLVSFLNNLDSN